MVSPAKVPCPLNEISLFSIPTETHFIEIAEPLQGFPPLFHCIPTDNFFCLRPTIILSQYPLPYDRLTEAYSDSREKGVHPKGLVGLELEMEQARTKALRTRCAFGKRARREFFRTGGGGLRDTGARRRRAAAGFER
jgi:hypothetical protein